MLWIPTIEEQFILQNSRLEKQPTGTNPCADFNFGHSLIIDCAKEVNDCNNHIGPQIKTSC